jgi:hypothetical protein
MDLNYLPEEKLPDDFDQILIEAERLGWVFKDGKWVQSGWRDKTSQQLYLFIKYK